MKIVVLGADGYLGWPTAMHFSAVGDEVHAVDNFSKRKWELEEGIEPLVRVPTLHHRVKCWHEVTGSQIHLHVGDLCNHQFVYKFMEDIRPDVIIHYAEQPSAPYSMQSRSTAVDTQINNIAGNLNVMFAIQRFCPEAHLVKLGTMGEYGTPNIDIEEGWLEVEHNGRKDTVMYPKRPGSFYHLSKVCDSQNIEFACRIWNMRATDLNQGVVYGLETDQTKLHPDLSTSFHYDDVFGTVLNRFLVQASVGSPLSVYGEGGQTRGFLNIRDTLQCVDLASRKPAERGEFRVFNQFTEQFSVMELAKMVRAAGKRAGMNTEISTVKNPRVEMEQHYYNAAHTKLLDLGLQPNLLTENVLDLMLNVAAKNSKHVNKDVFTPRIAWAGGGVSR